MGREPCALNREGEKKDQQHPNQNNLPHTYMYKNSKDLQIMRSFEFSGLSEELLELATGIKKSALIVYKIFISDLKSC